MLNILADVFSAHAFLIKFWLEINVAWKNMFAIIVNFIRKFQLVELKVAQLKLGLRQQEIDA